MNGEKSLFLQIRTFHLKLQTLKQQIEISPCGWKQKDEISSVNLTGRYLKMYNVALATSINTLNKCSHMDSRTMPLTITAVAANHCLIHVTL